METLPYEAFLSELLSRSRLFLSQEELQIISDKTIAQAGFGGVGALVIELLARWGVKKFRLLDMDKYEISNMNRQIYATVNTIGYYKAEVVANKIKEINPFVEIEMVCCEKLNHYNTRKLIEGADIIIRGADLPSGNLLLHHYAKKYKVPLITGHCHAVTGGLVRIFDYRLPRQRSITEPSRYKWVNDILYRYFGVVKNEIENIPEDKFDEIDKEFQTSGTLNFVTNLLACLVVSETIKLMLNKGKRVLYPKEIYIDLFDLRLRVQSAYHERVKSFLLNKIIKKLFTKGL